MQKSQKPKFLLKYNKPSLSGLAWEGALPLGNSKMGALVQAGSKQERIMFTLADAVYGGSVGVLPDVSDKLKEVRRLAQANNHIMAGITIENALEAKKYNPSVDQLLPLANLVIKHTNGGRISNFIKSLAMDQEEVSVGFSLGQLKIERNAFVSFNDGLFYLEITKSGPCAMDVEISLEPHDKSKLVYNNDIAVLPDEEYKDVSSNFLVYESRRNGKAFGVVARVAVDNKAVITTNEERVRFEGAEKIVVIAKCYTGKVKDKLFDKIKSELGLFKQISYEKAHSAHLDKYLKVWGKSELSINGAHKDLFINELDKYDYENISDILYEKLFHYAKYLAVCGIGDNFSLPFYGGLWGTYYKNDDSLLDFSLGVPAMYSVCNQLGLSSKTEGVIAYIQKYTDDLKKNANRLYKSSGYMVPNSAVMGSMLPARKDAKNISTITAGGVMACMLYDYFLYTKDLKFLSGVVLPFLTNVVEFYLNYFYENEKGEYKSVPSHSPGGVSKYFEVKNLKVYDTAMCDFVVARCAVKCILDICNVYSLPVAKIVDYQKFYNKLSLQIETEDGERKEFKTDVNSDLSAGVLHLFDVFGFNDGEKGKAGVLGSLKSRLGVGLYNQSLISLARCLEMSAICGAKDLFAGGFEFLNTNYLSENLIYLNNNKYGAGDNKSNYFNVAGNMLVASCLIKSLVQDDQNNIIIFPSKPASFESGSLTGVYTKNSAIVDISYDDKRGNMQVSVKALKATTFNLVLFKGVKKVKGYTFDVNNPVLSGIKLTAGKNLQFDIKY